MNAEKSALMAEIEPSRVLRSKHMMTLHVLNAEPLRSANALYYPETAPDKIRRRFFCLQSSRNHR